MNTPSKNMSASLRGQGGKAGPAETPTVSKQRPMTAASSVLPGEHGVEQPPGAVHPRSAQHYAGAVGGHFGGKR
jgi:hypothetical protein